MLAYDFPLLSLFWTILWIVIWVAWFLLVIRVFGDIFRSRDLGGVAKALWSIFVIVLPYLGVFVYLIARGGGMAERDMAVVQANETAFQEYVRNAAGTGASAADELVKLADLRDRGVLSAEEFERQKSALLA